MNKTRQRLIETNYKRYTYVHNSSEFLIILKKDDKIAVNVY